MKICIFIFFVVFIASAQAQEMVGRTSRQLGAGNIVSLPAVGDVVAFNPAVNIDENGLSASVGYVLPYQLSSFKQQLVRVLWTSRLGSFSADGGLNGDANSNLSRVGVGYARQFGPNWRAGLRYYYLSHHFGTRENFSSSFSLAGLSYRSADGDIVFSVSIQNIEQQKISYYDRDGQIPSVAITGLQWQPSKGLFLLMEVEKDFDFEPVFKGAIIYHYDALMEISFGAASPELELSAGIGVLYRGVRLHVGVSHHRELGFSSGASLSVVGLFSKQQ